MNIDPATWALDPSVVHLNHGSYGACPRPVLAHQRELRDALEGNPTRWFEETYPPLLAATRTTLAEFVGSTPELLGLVTNATSGVTAALAAVTRGLPRGRQVLVTDHVYAACRNALDAMAGHAGLDVVVARLPERPGGPQEVLDAVLAAVGPRTGAVLVDHVTSDSALVLPVDALVRTLEPAVTVVIDGSHAPGTIPLDLDALGASFYAGNAHKWLCAPKGAAFLRVGEEWLDRTWPPTVSHGWTSAGGPAQRFADLFAWQGTADPTAWLSIPAALSVVGRLHAQGWPGVLRSNRDLVLRWQARACEALGTEPPAPPGITGAMALVPLPPHLAAVPGPELTARVRHHGVEAKVVPSAGGAVRLSAQRYNTDDDVERLLDALAAAGRDLVAR